MTSERKFWIVFSVLTLLAGLALGGIYGRETAPKNFIKVSKNGTLEAFDAFWLATQFPDDLTDVRQISTQNRIVFLWTGGGRSHRYLYVMVLDK